MKLGTLVQFTALGKVLDTGYVMKYDDDPEMNCVNYFNMGPQRVYKDSTMQEVISEAG